MSEVKHTGLLDNRLAFSIDEFCNLIGISRGHYYQLVKSQKLKIVKVGGKSLITRDEAHRLLSDAEVA